MLYDLSQPLVDGMSVYPGDEPVHVVQNRHLEQDGYNGFRTTMGQHAGTHVDGPMHMTPDTTRIGQLPLEKFQGPCWVYDVRGRSVIGVDALDLSHLAEGRVILFWTAFDERFGTDAYYAGHPVLTEELAEALCRAGVRLVGIDAPSPDRFPFPVHKRLLPAGILILENLTGLSAIAAREGVRFYGFPLALATDASPVRAVAEIEP